MSVADAVDGSSTGTGGLNEITPDIRRDVTVGRANAGLFRAFRLIGREIRDVVAWANGTLRHPMAKFLFQWP